MTALIATLAAVAFTLARWQTWAHGRIGRFILVGRHFATPSQLPHGMPVAKTYGYDGQFFYRLALNPLNFRHTAYGITIDRPYRYMRIGYPALTWLVSAGQHALVPVMLVMINIASIGALGYLGAMFAAQGGRHAAWGLLLPGYFGLLTSLSRDTAEPLAAVCLLAGLLAVRSRRPVLAAVLLAYGALTRETVMVAVAAIATMRVIAMLRRRAQPGREDLTWLVPAVAFDRVRPNCSLGSAGRALRSRASPIPKRSIRRWRSAGLTACAGASTPTVIRFASRPESPRARGP